MTYEEWREIEGWPYEVSNFGRVKRSQKNARNAADGACNTYVGKVLKPSLNAHGYPMVTLVNIKSKNTTIHQLVCRAFHGGPPFEGAKVRHLDGDRANNRASNLAWGGVQDMADDRKRRGTQSRGSRCSHLTSEQVAEIRRRHATSRRGYKRAPNRVCEDLAREFGVHRNSITRIVSRQRHK